MESETFAWPPTAGLLVHRVYCCDNNFLFVYKMDDNEHAFWRIGLKNTADYLPSFKEIRDYIFQNYEIRITSADVATHLNNHLVIRLCLTGEQSECYKIEDILACYEPIQSYSVAKSKKADQVRKRFYNKVPMTLVCTVTLTKQKNFKSSAKLFRKYLKTVSKYFCAP